MNNVIITACNDPYYLSVLTLINSIHKLSLDIVDRIYVYNLGLKEEYIKNLNRLEKVKVLEFSESTKNSHSKFLVPKQHVYKLFCVKSGDNLGKNVLWLDAGVMALKSVKEIFDIIEKEDIFMVGDVHLNQNFTHKECIKIMNATQEELQKPQLSSGILGYKVNGKYQALIDEAYNYSLIENCVNGDQEDHRHDQSVYSILAARYEVKTYNIDRYGYWTDFYRNLKTAIENEAVIYVHRNGHHEFENLIYAT